MLGTAHTVPGEPVRTLDPKRVLILAPTKMTDGTLVLRLYEKSKINIFNTISQISNFLQKSSIVAQDTFKRNLLKTDI